MSNSTLQAQIDALFDAEGEERPDQLKFFLDKIHSNYAEVCKTTVRRGITFCLIWFVTYLVATGFVSEGRVSAFKVQDIQLLLVVAPLLIGIAGYGYYAAIAATTLSWVALQCFYKHFLPTAHKLTLEHLAAPFTITNIERVLSPGNERPFANAVHTVSNVPTFVLMFCGPFAAFAHVCYLLWSQQTWSIWWLILSGGAGMILLIKGVLLIAWEEMYT